MNIDSVVAKISPITFDVLLNAYSTAIPERLLELDHQRYDVIPERARQSKPSGCTFLTKDELVALVDWKLSHGKFRPVLKSLIQGNEPDLVKKTTAAGFSIFASSTASVKESLATLTKLKGVGPATASLLLSVFSPEIAPFFSDELFRWCFYEEYEGKGWDREIKYSAKEYMELIARVSALRDRLKMLGRETSAVEIEKVAYVLGKGDVERKMKIKDATTKTEKKRKVVEDREGLSTDIKLTKLTTGSNRGSSKTSRKARETTTTTAASTRPRRLPKSNTLILGD